MEEIIMDSMEELGGNGMSILQEMTEKSRLDGAQIGVPWAKNVYEYLFELPLQDELDIILNDMMEPVEADYDIR